MQRRNIVWPVLLGALLTLGLAIVIFQPGAARASTAATTYSNPAHIVITGTTGMVQSFADPSVIRGNDGFYYAFATTDALSDTDKIGPNWNYRLIPIIRSPDMVDWTYIGDAFSSRPSWAASNAGLWAPDVKFMNGKYYLYYTVTATASANNSSAIGVATSDSPAGPWVDSGGPVVAPRPNAPLPTDNYFNTFDPDVVDTGSAKYIFYGSYYGGIQARQLSADGFHSVETSTVQITIANRYEGANIVWHDGFWYLMASATNCCYGPLTGYSVFAGRSTDIMGPYLDRDGESLLVNAVGGTTVISMNGNRWVGPGHTDVISDTAGQDWLFYHAVDETNPFFAGTTDYTKRPLLMDQLTWIDGWPTVRSGYWASDSPQPAPIVDSGATPAPTMAPKPDDQPGSVIPNASDDFNGALGSQWAWVRQPSTSTYSLSDNPGSFRFQMQAADLNLTQNNASVLYENAPSGDFLVEAKLTVSLRPSEGCCFNYQQAGLVIYANDNNYLKLTNTSIWETRQSEWGKEVSPYPYTGNNIGYGNSVIGPVARQLDVQPAGPEGSATSAPTWLRIAVHRVNATDELFTGYSSLDGVSWVRGATWTHSLGGMKIGLVSMGGSGHYADFDYVHVYSITAPPTAVPSATSTTVVTGTTTAMPSTTVTTTAVASTTASPSVTTTATPCGITFTDVMTTDYFYEPVRYLFCKGAISGYSDNTFRPYNNITRGQVVKIVVLGFGFPTDTTGAPHFTDVPSSNPFYSFIETATNHVVNGQRIISGYSSATDCAPAAAPCFKPFNDVTRGQLSKIVVLGAGWTLANPTTPTFTDVSSTNPFYTYIETAYSHHIISGYTATTGLEFRWQNNATRGQVAKIVQLAVTSSSR